MIEFMRANPSFQEDVGMGSTSFVGAGKANPDKSLNKLNLSHFDWLKRVKTGKFDLFEM